MNHATTCKYCHKPIVLTVDDDYGTEFDSFKLLPYSACNRCADLRVRRRVLEEAIERIAGKLLQFSGKTPESTLDICRESLTQLTKKYTAMVADWVGSSSPYWDSEIVSVIMDHPKAWNKSLALCWHLYTDKKPAPQPEPEPELLPQQS